MTEEARLRAEIIPSMIGDVSALASANAPFVYFDLCPTSGVRDGIANITLEAGRYSVADGGNVVWDRVLVAHLRCGLGGIVSLKNAIASIERALTPPEGGVN